MKGQLAKVIKKKDAPSLQLSTSLMKEAVRAIENAPIIPIVTRELGRISGSSLPAKILGASLIGWLEQKGCGLVSLASVVWSLALRDRCIDLVIF